MTPNKRKYTSNHDPNNKYTPHTQPMNNPAYYDQYGGGYNQTYYSYYDRANYINDQMNIKMNLMQRHIELLESQNVNIMNEINELKKNANKSYPFLSPFQVPRTHTMSAPASKPKDATQPRTDGPQFFDILFTTSVDENGNTQTDNCKDSCSDSLINFLTQMTGAPPKQRQAQQEPEPESVPEPNYDNVVIDEIDVKIDTLQDLILVCEKYQNVADKKYSFDTKILKNLHAPLKKLNEMIGLNDIKNNIVDTLTYYLQNFELKNKDLLNTVITGPPGVGKTEFAKILADIYVQMGVIKNKKFTIIKRSDCVGKYLGSSTPKTEEILKNAKGGVVFIDEAYSMGDPDKRDNFSKEALDALNQFISENPDTIFIIAGYPDELEKCFFSINPGLKSRFTTTYHITGYSVVELRDIFKHKIMSVGWGVGDINDNVMDKLFADNKDKFPFSGRDIATLFLNCKYTHGRRTFGKHPKLRKRLTDDDIIKGFDRYTNNSREKTVELSYYS